MTEAETSGSLSICSLSQFYWLAFTGGRRLGRCWLRLVCAALAAILTSSPSIARETVTYVHDPLGRLIASSISGGLNNGSQTGAVGEHNAGTYTFNCVVANSLSATSTGQLTATVTGMA